MLHVALILCASLMKNFTAEVFNPNLIWVWMANWFIWNIQMNARQITWFTWWIYWTVIGCPIYQPRITRLKYLPSTGSFFFVATVVNVLYCRNQSTLGILVNLYWQNSFVAAVVAEICRPQGFWWIGRRWWCDDRPWTCTCEKS